MSKLDTNSLKKARSSAVGSTPKGGVRSSILGMAGKRAAMCSPEPEMGRSSKHMDPDSVAELKKMKFRG